MTEQSTNISVHRGFRLGGYATGDYMCKCLSCDAEFCGDKRAIYCLPCAVDHANSRAEAPKTEGVGLVERLQRALAGYERRAERWMAATNTSGSMKISILAPDLRLVLKALTAPTMDREAVIQESWRTDREAIARIIDPAAWADADRWAGKPKSTKGEFFPPSSQWRQTQDSLAKADQIIAGQEVAAPADGVLEAPRALGTGGHILPEPGWIEWKGGARPVPGKTVEVRLRGGETARRLDEPGWVHLGHPSDIIAYRILPANLSNSGGE